MCLRRDINVSICHYKLPSYYCFCCISEVLEYFVVIFICFKIFSDFPFYAFFDPSFCSAAGSLISTLCEFSNFSFVTDFQFLSIAAGKDTWYGLSL